MVGAILQFTSYSLAQLIVGRVASEFIHLTAVQYPQTGVIY